MISKSPEDLQYYEDRLKFLRDERGKLLAAEQDGEQRGLAKGEQIGLAKGKLAGKIQMLQELLGEPPTADSKLESQDAEELSIHFTKLQQRLRDRQA